MSARIDATSHQVQRWVETARIDLENEIASVERALALSVFKSASPQRTRLETNKARLRVDLGVIETLWACHERWRLAREGMKVLVESNEEEIGETASIIYESGPMNEVAREMWPDMRDDPMGSIDVTPIFDKMREAYQK